VYNGSAVKILYTNGKDAFILAGGSLPDTKQGTFLENVNAQLQSQGYILDRNDIYQTGVSKTSGSTYEAVYDYMNQVYSVNAASQVDGVGTLYTNKDNGSPTFVGRSHYESIPLNCATAISPEIIKGFMYSLAATQSQRENGFAGMTGLQIAGMDDSRPIEPVTVRNDGVAVMPWDCWFSASGDGSGDPFMSSNNHRLALTAATYYDHVNNLEDGADAPVTDFWLHTGGENAQPASVFGY
jgi:hypothetical protein